MRLLRREARQRLAGGDHAKARAVDGLHRFVRAFQKTPLVAPARPSAVCYARADQPRELVDHAPRPLRIRRGDAVGQFEAFFGLVHGAWGPAEAGGMLDIVTGPVEELDGTS